MPTPYDAIVIGTGQAGPALAARLAKAGRNTAIIERKRFGGTCVNVGCVPTKTLVASARAAHVARTGDHFGVMIDAGFRIDMARVKARKDEVVRASTTGVEQWLRGTKGLTVIQGHAAFEGPHTVRVGAEVLEAPEIFINVGGRASTPEIPGLADVPYLNSTSIMELDVVPAHLLIIGGSYIGLEFAQMMRRFGARVTVIEMGPRLIAREDEDVSDAIRAILEREGVAFRLNAKCLSVSKRGVGDGIAVGVNCNGEHEDIIGSHLLLAVGRLPNTHDLGLDRAGITADARGFITVDEQLCTNVPGVWALGDVNGRGAFTHTSWNDYEIVAANLLDAGTRKVTDRIPAYALFIDPPLGRVGMNEREVRTAYASNGRKALCAKMPMTRVGRARERGETQGFMKVLVDAESKRILGAALLGIEGDEAIHSIIDIMVADAPYTTIGRAMHIHPTVSELIPTLLEGLKPLD
jgi:pyruvate/2-oxoglutarate dehydrogenase complex dihydrolipoamide dehydrogenase (E3) component